MSRFSFPLTDLFDTEKPKEVKTLRRELTHLAEYEVLDPVRHFLRCYPHDSPTIEGHLCWLNALRSLRPGKGVWDHALMDLRRYRDMDEGVLVILTEKAFEKLRADKVEAVLLFMKEHADEFATVSVDILGPLLDEMLGYLKTAHAQQTFLVRLEKLIAQRYEAGEKAVRPIMEKIRRTLQKLAKRKGPTMTRKKKP